MLHSFQDGSEALNFCKLEKVIHHKWMETGTLLILD